MTGRRWRFTRAIPGSIDENEAFPVSEERICELLERLQAFGVSFTIENVEDYGQYGLEDPLCTIDLATKDNTITYSADDVYFAQLDGTKLPLDASKVDSYLQTIGSLDLTNYVSYNVTDEELRAFGLDSTDLTITVDYTAEDTEEDTKQEPFVLHISRDSDEKDAADGGETDGEDVTAYARIGQSQIIYQLFSSEYKELTAASCDDLRHAEVFWGDFADVRQIGISLEGEEYAIVSKKGGRDRAYFYEGEELEIADLQDALEALRANSFTDEKPAQQEEIGLTLSLDNDNQRSVSIALYRYDGSDCLAVVDGEPVSLVQCSAVVDLIEAEHAIVLN